MGVEEKQQQQEAVVVIVGAGIAGLATAVAMKRVGQPCLVLERSPDLRATGTALSLSPNAWRALEALGVAHKLIPLYTAIQKALVTDLSTGSTSEVSLAGTDRVDAVVRSVHRKVLLETLAEELQPGTIRFSSKITSIDQERPSSSSSTTTLHLDDGSVIKAKVVIGCDGVHSMVARWLGLSEPVRSGRSAIRGLAVFPDGHELKNDFVLYFGDGKRGGLVRLNNHERYFFISHISNESAEKEMAGNPDLIMKEVTERLAKDFPPEFQMAARRLEVGTLTWAPLMLRLPWDIVLGRTHRGCVAVAGDAMHPMTPDLGQGGCAALEDAVVLGRCLARARSPDQFAAGLERYASERRWRTAGIVAAVFLIGWVQDGGTTGVLGSVVKWFRRRIYFRFVHRRIVEAILGYDCGELPPAE